MKIKKVLLVIFINILILFFLAETACFLHNSNGRIPRKYEWYEYQSFDKVYEMIRNEKLHKPIGLEYKNRPILLMGCSYAYGYQLNDNETFAYLLSETMKRPLYNRAYELNWGANTMLYQARRDDFYNEVPNPEYVIYVFTGDHIEKANCSAFDTMFKYPTMRYILKNGHLEPEKFPWRYNLHMFRTYSEYKAYRYDREYLDNSINEFFIETKQEFDKHWKNYKFIILVYERDEYYTKSDHNNWKELEKQGFSVVSTTDLTGRKMDKEGDFISDNYHPSAKAWKMLTPKFIQWLEKLK